MSLILINEKMHATMCAMKHRERP